VWKPEAVEKSLPFTKLCGLIWGPAHPRRRFKGIINFRRSFPFLVSQGQQDLPLKRRNCWYLTEVVQAARLKASHGMMHSHGVNA
jgi:hypothetical protein